MSATAAAWCLAQVWRKAPFRKRKLLLKVLQQYIIEHQAEICRYVELLSFKQWSHCILRQAGGRLNLHPLLVLRHASEH